MRQAGSLNHSRWDCKYHVVLIPKYRKKAIFGQIRSDLGDVMRRLAEQNESQIEEGHLMSEHVHIEIRRRSRRKFSPEEKIRIVLEGLRGEESIADLCRREGIASNLYYRWSKDFLEAGKKQLAGVPARGESP
jgi:hypothetical protein